MENKTTLVFGASLNPDRYSNIAIHRLTQNKIPTLAFGLRSGLVAGIAIDTTKIQYPSIHTIALYINPKRQTAYYNYLISLHPKRVIFNPGTENPDFMDLLNKNGIAYEIACTLSLLATNQY
ncbi:MAG TPA: CoA-binding protein [Saprospiraceae bacterium]|nr:CoA-binding protein [Saprospiraceae bacterium]